MELTIAGKKISLNKGITVNLKYDCVASSFSTAVLFNPDVQEHMQLFRPFSYNKAVITHNGETVLTGVCMTHNFKDSAESELLPISGYSLPGVLENSDMPPTIGLQSENLTLKEIAEKVIAPFGLSLKIDESVADRANAPIQISTSDDAKTVKAYLSELAAQRHIILSHDEYGNLLFTSADTSAPNYDFTTPEVQRIKKVGRVYSSIYHFERGMKGVKFDFSCDGQRIHSDIFTQSQRPVEGGNSGWAVYKNPYCKTAFRAKVAIQMSGTDNSTSFTGRNVVSTELNEAIILKIEIEGWELNGKVVRPNNIITVKNERLFLFRNTKFFIKSVELKGDEKSGTATLVCVLPEVFNTEPVVNIFEKLAAGRSPDEVTKHDERFFNSTI